MLDQGPSRKLMTRESHLLKTCDSTRRVLLRLIVNNS